VIYSDFTVNLEKNPLTGLLARVTNEESVKQSLSNIVKTMRRERFNQPLVGSKLAGSLFEFIDEQAATEIRETLLASIQADEPRAQNVVIEVKHNMIASRNQVVVTIIFSMINIPERISFDVILKRVR
jgi:phage baseplate assembly protein W